MTEGKGDYTLHLQIFVSLKSTKNGSRKIARHFVNFDALDVRCTTRLQFSYDAAWDNEFFLMFTIWAL